MRVTTRQAERRPLRLPARVALGAALVFACVGISAADNGPQRDGRIRYQARPAASATPPYMGE